MRLAVVSVFIDTSGFYALLVADDQMHERALSTLRRLRTDDVELVTSSFVIQETIALFQNRIGMAAVRGFVERIASGITVQWIDEELFAAAVTALLAADSRAISLTDWTSFEIMRRLRIRQAFAFDQDFVARGFELL